MIQALIVSNALLWVGVIALLAVVLALLRQIGVLQERVLTVGALVGAETPRPGEAAPPLDVVDWAGNPLTLGRTAMLLFFVSPTCPVCKTLLPVARSVSGVHDTPLLFASDGPRAEHESFVREHRLGTAEERYVLSTELGLLYQIARLPYAILIDGAGVVRARGLVNSREHLESLFHAQELEVASVQEYIHRDEQVA